MKKIFMTAILAGLMAVSMSMTAFAGQWQQDAKGWWYQNDDKTYLKDGWKWVDGKCYYFTSDGYCLTGTQTPDGYTVDASGAWIVDGVVQTQGGEAAAAPEQSTVTAGGLTLAIPNGFSKYSEEDGFVYLANSDTTAMIALASESLADLGFSAEELRMLTALSDYILDEAMKENTGVEITGTNLQLANRTWRFYDYGYNPVLEIPGQTQVYARLTESHLYMIFFAGELSGMDTTSIMQNNLR